MNWIIRRPLLGLTLCGVLTALMPPAIAQNSFTVTRLGWLSGGDRFKTSQGVSINNSGQIVGVSSGIEIPPFGGPLHAFLWDSTNGMQYVFDSLYDPTKFFTQTYRVNDNGAVLGGYSGPNDANNSGSFLYDSGTVTPLKKPDGKNFTFVFGMNNANQVAGQVFYSDTRTLLPALWDSNGDVTVLTPPGTGSRAYAINDAGQVAIETNLSSRTDPNLPYLWDSTNGYQALPYLGVGGGVRALSGKGNVAGYVELQLGHKQDHAALWSGGKVTDIHGLGVSSLAVDVNDAGRAIGAYDVVSTNAASLYGNLFNPSPGFYYADGKMRSLLGMTDESLPYTAIVPYAINSKGQIAAQGTVSVEIFPGVFGIKYNEALLLTPSDTVLPLPVDVTASFGTTVGSQRYNPTAKLWEKVVTLKNLSGKTLKGPLRVIVSTSIPSSYLVSPEVTGKTQIATPLNSSYYSVEIPGGKLAPGKSVSLPFRYSLAALFGERNITVNAVYTGPGRL